MSVDLLTTKEMQEILHVDRTTIYRMAEGNRIPALKVGNQWRFPRQQIERWLQQDNTAPVVALEGPTSNSARTTDLFPVACIQLIQDSFADALGVMILVTDLQGNLITRPSNSCGLYAAVEISPIARERRKSLWIDLVNQPSLGPMFQQSYLGLLWGRGLVRVGNEIKAMLVMGGIAPEVWPPDDEHLSTLSDTLQVNIGLLQTHIGHVHILDPEQQARVLPFVQRIADILSHIAGERHQLFGRLQQIAEISQL